MLRGGLRPWSRKGPNHGVGVDPETVSSCVGNLHSKSASFRDEISEGPFTALSEYCPAPVFPVLVFQLSKQQNRTRTKKFSTVLGTPPNRTRTKKFPLEELWGGCFVSWVLNWESSEKLGVPSFLGVSQRGVFVRGANLNNWGGVRAPVAKINFAFFVRGLLVESYTNSENFRRVLTPK